MFNDPDVKHLADNDISLEVYTDHQVNILGKCQFYVLHPDSKKQLEVTFYVASNESSVLLSSTTLLALDLIQARPHLDYLPPRAKLITSTADHPEITKRTCHQTREHPKPQKHWVTILQKIYDSIKSVKMSTTVATNLKKHWVMIPWKIYDSVKLVKMSTTVAAKLKKHLVKIPWKIYNSVKPVKMSITVAANLKMLWSGTWFHKQFTIQ